MILLSFISLAWAVSVLSTIFYSWVCVCWGNKFKLKRACLVIVHDAGESEEYQSVDITREMLYLHRDGGMVQDLDVLPRLTILEPPRSEVKEALRACHARNQSNREDGSRKSPLCFLDVTYTMNSSVWSFWPRGWLRNQREFRCLYPIYDFFDEVSYPPKCTWVSRESSLVSAILSIRLDQPHGISSSKRCSCHVTDRIRLLEGPLGDFHRRTSMGYHLRKHILKVVLMSDIRALAESLNYDDSSVNAPGGGSRQKTPVHFNKNTVSVRLQFKGPPRRVEVVTLEKSA